MREGVKIGNNSNIRTINGITERQCVKCLQWLEENDDNYYMKNKSKPEMGYVARCKKCSIKDVQNYEKRDPEKVKKCRLLAYRRHQESKNQRNKNWQHENAEYYKEYVRSYWKANPEKIKEYNEKRRHKNHRITDKEWLACKTYFDFKCAYCGITEEEHKQKYKNRGLNKEHVDHEGNPYLDNCVPACTPCNSRKWKHPMEEWYKLQDYFSEEKLQKIYKWITEDYQQYTKPNR